MNRFYPTALVYAACSLLPAAALAGDVLDALGPERIGTALDSVLQGAPLTCRHDPDDASIRLCEPLPDGLGTLGGVPVGSVVATFSDQRLAQVAMHFPESSFAGIKALLIARLGEGEDASYAVRAGMAGTFTNEVMLWETDDLVAIARQYDGKIDRSSLIYGLPGALSRLLKQTRSKLPGARDL